MLSHESLFIATNFIKCLKLSCNPTIHSFLLDAATETVISEIEFSVLSRRAPPRSIAKKRNESGVLYVHFD